MIILSLAILLGSAAVAAPPSAPAPAPGVKSSTAAAAAIPPMIGLSTYTVSTLYTGDRSRDPFLPASMGGPSRTRDRSQPIVVDIHALQLRGIMKDAGNDFALFSSDDGTTLVLKGGRLFDDRNKAVPGITGRLHIAQKRVELVTADKDVQIYVLGEAGDADKTKPAKP